MAPRRVPLLPLSFAAGAVSHSFVEVPGQNAVPDGQKTTQKSLAACEATCTGTCLQISFNTKSQHCYTSTSDVWSATANDRVTSGCVAGKVSGCPGAPPAPPPGVPTPAPAPAPAPTPGGTCNGDADCSRNGVCVAGSCSCDPAWTGKQCQTLNIVPGKKESGYRWIESPSNGGNYTSSWGASTWYDDTAGKWYMYATELAEHCGMHSWTMNSQVVLASSADPLGLYRREKVIVPIWSHEVEVARGPGGEYVAFFSYSNPSPRPVCHTCTDATTDKECKKKLAAPRIEDSDPTYMSWAPRPEGPWSTPVRVQPNTTKGTVQMDSNFAAVIHADGSLVGMWRDHMPGGKHSTPHPVTASDWKDPATYRWGAEQLFPDKVVKGAIEDMFVWVDTRGYYHTLFHMMYDCDNCIGHAHSADGAGWTWTGICATADTTYTDGSTMTFSHLERPQLVFDKSGKVPVAVTNGVKTDATGLANNDQSFTLLRPLNQQ